MKIFLEDGNWTEEGKVFAKDFAAAVAPVFEHWLRQGADCSELYRVAINCSMGPVFNAWMEAMSKMDNQND